MLNVLCHAGFAPHIHPEDALAACVAAVFAVVLYCVATRKAVR